MTGEQSTDQIGKGSQASQANIIEQGITQPVFLNHLKSSKKKKKQTKKGLKFGDYGMIEKIKNILPKSNDSNISQESNSSPGVRIVPRINNDSQQES